nr:hypothetical protein BgiMline_022695 [Biomphalaria glabrata]
MCDIKTCDIKTCDNKVVTSRRVTTRRVTTRRVTARNFADEKYVKTDDVELWRSGVRKRLASCHRAKIIIILRIPGLARFVFRSCISLSSVRGEPTG